MPWRTVTVRSVDDETPGGRSFSWHADEGGPLLLEVGHEASDVRAERFGGAT